jgi:hypothetical protein
MDAMSAPEVEVTAKIAAEVTAPSRPGRESPTDQVASGSCRSIL